MDWTTKKYSDLDLVIFNANFSIIEDLKEAFTESDLIFTVDVLSWEKITDDFKVNIKKKYIVLQKAKKDLKIYFEKDFKETEIGKIPVDWEVKSIGDVCENVSRKFNFKDKKNVYLINTRDVLNGKFLNLKLSKNKNVLGQFKKAIKNNNILFSEIRPLNKRFAIVKNIDHQNSVVSTKFMVLEKNNKINLSYFYTILFSQNTLNYFNLIANTRSGTFPQITFNSIKNFKIPLPPLTEQKNISKILSDLDEKIEINKKQNEILEEIGKTIFKRWFVDFEFPTTPSNPNGFATPPQEEGNNNRQDVNKKSSPPFKEGWLVKQDGVVSNKKNLKTFRKKLRNNATPAEAKLWTYLKSKGLKGRKFRRQHSIENYILDFYCPAEKLAIELDGEIHNNPSQAEYDYERDLFLQYYGIKILRFENKVVFNNSQGLLENIKGNFEWEKTTPSNPNGFATPPQEEGNNNRQGVNKKSSPPFKEGWLVKQDGVVNKTNTYYNGYKSSGGAMVYNKELEKEIPEGWSVGKVGDLVEIKIERTPPRKETQWFTTNKKDNKWISIKDLGENRIFIFNTKEHLTTKAIKKFNIPIIKKDTLIMSFKLTIGRLAITTEEMLSNEAIAQFYDKDDLLKYYLYLYFSNFNFSSLGNTSSIAKAINSTTIKNITLYVPSKNFLINFNKTIKPLFNQILENSKENQKLQEIRDYLLPKLMKGEVRVKNSL